MQPKDHETIDSFWFTRISQMCSIFSLAVHIIDAKTSKNNKKR